MIEYDSEIIFPISKSLLNNEKGFSTSRYLFGVAYLKGHKKLKSEEQFTLIAPTREDFSRLVMLLKEFGLSLD